MEMYKNNEETEYFELNYLCTKVEKVMFLHVDTHKYTGLKLFYDSECDIDKQNKTTNLG